MIMIKHIHTINLMEHTNPIFDKGKLFQGVINKFQDVNNGVKGVCNKLNYVSNKVCL